jgi:integrase
VNGALTLGELMARFLTHKRSKASSGELSKTTLGDYLREVKAFVAFQKPFTPAGGLKPEHFSAYMRHLVEERKLGRPARKRVRAYVTAFLRFGAQNGWMVMPATGSDWVAPATDQDSMRQAKARLGLKDHSDRVLTGEEITRLLDRANPTFKAMILLGVNCGLGPADIGRVRWNMIDLKTRTLCFPRPKTGTIRVGCLWKKTRDALLRVRTLKHNQLALERDGDSALVFVTRTGLAYYREREVHAKVDVNGIGPSGGTGHGRRPGVEG